MLKHHIATNGDNQLRHAVASATQARRRVVRRPTEKPYAEGTGECGHYDAIDAHQGDQQSVSEDRRWGTD